VSVGLKVGVLVGLNVGLKVGVSVGLNVTVGLNVSVGWNVSVGSNVSVGKYVGTILGLALGQVPQETGHSSDASPLAQRTSGTSPIQSQSFPFLSLNK
jgi:acyl-[acyl carrier protein]--UDP-N-acetylglucosamine O-acyltransferase